MEQKLNLKWPIALNEREWLKRTYFPIGLDNNNEFFSLVPTEQLFPNAPQLYSAKKMIDDLSVLNEI